MNGKRKRCASDDRERSPGSDSGFPSPSDLSIRKRRFANNLEQNGQSSDLSISTASSRALNRTLANAGSSKSNPLLPPTLAGGPRSGRRTILLNPPFPSPLIPKNQFSILSAMLSHMDILLNVTSYLHPTTLLNLYSISAPFHYLMDSHFTTFIMACTRTWAPDADKYYPWWCFRQLCIEDPALRRAKTIGERRGLSWTDKDGKAHTCLDNAAAESLQNPPQRKASDEVLGHVEGSVRQAVSVKAIPSFRWLKMVFYREAVSREIVGWMAVRGHRMPREESVNAVKKIWFLLDIPVSAPRVALIHNTAYFTHNTLLHMQLFFIKLDMLYQDPIHNHGGEYTMREFLMAERTLTTLWNYLRGADGVTRLDILRLWVRHGYRRPVPSRPMTRDVQAAYDSRRSLPVMGVPPHLVGRWGFECWGLGKYPLMRPDQLVLREGVRRRLQLQRFYLIMIAVGYVDGDLDEVPAAKEEEVVPSLKLRKKNRDLVRNMQEMDINGHGAKVGYKGKGKQKMGVDDEDGHVDEDNAPTEKLRRAIFDLANGGQT